MNNSTHLPEADHVFDGGNLDCGSGLILLIRENMLQVPAGGVLEIRSSEPTVETELPAWCRMVGHQHLRSAEIADGQWRHFVQRGPDVDAEKSGLDSDKEKASEYKWSLRARRTNETDIYSRNFSWKSGHSIDFDRKGKLPTSLEQFFGSLVADLINSLVARCSRKQIEFDDLEATLNGTLHNPIAAAGIEEGDPSVKEIKVTVFATSPAAESEIRAEWELAVQGSPVFQTFVKSCPIELKLVLL